MRDALFDRVATRAKKFSQQINRRKHRALIGLLAAADADYREAKRRALCSSPAELRMYSLPGQDWRGRYG